MEVVIFRNKMSWEYQISGRDRDYRLELLTQYIRNQSYVH